MMAVSGDIPSEMRVFGTTASKASGPAPYSTGAHQSAFGPEPPPGLRGGTKPNCPSGAAVENRLRIQWRILLEHLANSEWVSVMRLARRPEGIATIGLWYDSCVEEHVGMHGEECRFLRFLEQAARDREEKAARDGRSGEAARKRRRGMAGPEKNSKGESRQAGEKRAGEKLLSDCSTDDSPSSSSPGKNSSIPTTSRPSLPHSFLSYLRTLADHGGKIPIQLLDPLPVELAWECMRLSREMFM